MPNDTKDKPKPKPQPGPPPPPNQDITPSTVRGNYPPKQDGYTIRENDNKVRKNPK